MAVRVRVPSSAPKRIAETTTVSAIFVDIMRFCGVCGKRQMFAASSKLLHTEHKIAHGIAQQSRRHSKSTSRFVMDILISDEL